jgi:N-acetyl-gamma-glutamyl-phosphate reductase
MKIAVFGISGFAGNELLRLLPKKYVEVVYKKTSREEIGKLEDASVVLLALRESESLSLVPELLSVGKTVIDLSGAYRLKNPNDYLKYYDWRHPYPELLEEAVYGMPEINRDKICSARLIANPGCYPTAIILGLRPLIMEGLLAESILIRAVSGYTGAGKNEKIPQAITPYKSGKVHRHIPEMEQELNIKDKISFFPQIAPWPRGIEAVIRFRIPIQINLLDLYKTYYRKEGFIRVKSEKITIDEVLKTNYCDILPMQKDSVAIIKVTIDNLVKGAAGQAIQNLNLIAGFQENEGL